MKVFKHEFIYVKRLKHCTFIDCKFENCMVAESSIVNLIAEKGISKEFIDKPKSEVQP